MKKIAFAAIASAAALALSACGSSDKASEEATAENVEVPAEEAMTDVDQGATPAADASAAAGADASASPAASAAASPAAGASSAAEQATTEAEKKM